MKRLAIYTTAFNLSVALDVSTIDSIITNLVNGETIVISDTPAGEPVTYWINPANVAALVITEVND
jgi:hypothetical protein